MSEGYLGLCRTAIVELYCENRKRLKDIKYFCKKTSSETFDRVLITPLKISFLKPVKTPP